MHLPENPQVHISHENGNLRKKLTGVMNEQFLIAHHSLPDKFEPTEFPKTKLILTSETAVPIQLELGLPYIVLGSNKDEFSHSQTAVKFIESGAESYIPENETPRVIASKTRAILRRYNNEDKQTKFEFGDFSLDLLTRDVSINNEKINLSKKQYEMLAYMLKNQGKVISRDQFLTNLWDRNYRDYIETRTVDVHISALRGKIGEDKIKSYRGLGYKFEPKGDKQE